MFEWLLALIIPLATGSLGTFAACLGLAIFFPRLTQLLFTTVAWPVWTLWVSMWMMILGWLFGACDFSWASYKSCVLISFIPIGIIMAYLADGVRELGHN